MSDETKIVNDNQQTVRVDNRANDTKNENNDTPPVKVTLHTIDSAIINYLSQRIAPIVTQNGTQVKVPVLYGSPERWKSVQKDGLLRDSIGKIQLPAIMLRRSNMEKTGINSPVNKYYERDFYTGWNRRTPYDRFNVVNGITPSREYYTATSTPDYYKITYKCMAWTEYMEQMNSVIENISFESDEFWGEPNQYKFRAIIKSFQPVTELPVNSDRVVRTQFDMTVYAYLLPESSLNKGLTRGQLIKKRYSPKKVVTFVEMSSTNSSTKADIEIPPPVPYTEPITTTTTSTTTTTTTAAPTTTTTTSTTTSTSTSTTSTTSTSTTTTTTAAPSVSGWSGWDSPLLPSLASINIATITE